MWVQALDELQFTVQACTCLYSQIVEETDAPPVKIKACTLDKPTQDLVKLIFDKDMFQSAMKKLDVGECEELLDPLAHYHLFLFYWTDTKKMPLGKLSKVQIAKGFEVCLLSLV